MSELQRKKSRRVPIISKDKLDEMPGNSAVGYEREDQWANAFIKKNGANTSINGKVTN